MAKFKRKSYGGVVRTSNTEYQARMADLRRKFKQAQAEVKRLYQEIEKMSDLTADVEFARRQKIAWDEGWDSKLTKAERLRFEKSWKQAFKASDGRVTPSPYVYRDIAAGNHKKGRKIRTTADYLTYSIAQANGYDNQGNVEAIANKMLENFPEDSQPYYDYLMQHSTTMRSGVMQRIYELVYEATSFVEIASELEQLTGIPYRVE